MTDKRKQILLISYEYPYGRGETFLDGEIKYLSQAFDIVWVLPSRAIWSKIWLESACSEQRALPNGCFVTLPNVHYSIVRRIDLIAFFRMLSRCVFSSTKNVSYYHQLKAIVREALKASMIIKAIRTFIAQNGTGIFSYSYWKSPAASALGLLKADGKIPSFVTRCHGGDLYYEVLAQPVRPYDLFVNNQSEAVIAISQHGVNYLLKKEFDRNKVILSRLGVTMPQVKARCSHDGILRIVSCSSIIPVKRLEILASALSMFIIPFEWTHFGDGRDKIKIEKILECLPSCGRANLLGWVDNPAVLLYYAQNPVDVFVNVSYSEGVPVSIMEALAAGIPCVATDVGGTSEIINDECGELISADISSKALAELLQSVSWNKKLWTAKRLGAERQARYLCDAQRNYSEFCNFLVTIQVADRRYANRGIGGCP